MRRHVFEFEVLEDDVLGMLIWTLGRLTEELHQLRQLNQDLHLKLSKSSDYG